MNQAEKLLANDPASKMLGINIVKIDHKVAELSMQVRQNMTNGYDVCHGGFIYTLADTACAFACADEGQVVLSSNGQIEYLAPASLGDQLQAKACVTCTAARNLFCDVVVSNQNNQTIALYRGKLHSKKAC